MHRGIASVRDGGYHFPTVMFVTAEIAAFRAWTKAVALTNLFAEGKLWISDRSGVRALENLDRLYRNAVRDGIITPE